MTSKLFEANKKAPRETIIHLSKTYYIWKAFVNLIWVCLGILMLLTTYKIFGIALIIYILYQSIKLVKTFKILNKGRVQIRLSSEGISLQGGKLFAWSSINNENIIVEPNYTASAISKEYFSFDVNGSNKKIFLNNLDISSLRLEYLLEIYRKRSQKKKR